MFGASKPRQKVGQKRDGFGGGGGGAEFNSYNYPVETFLIRFA
jgi:hypothetical protein